MENILIFIVSIVAGILTHIISHHLKKGPVLASGLVTLLSGIILPYLFLETGKTLMVVAACASYAGMASLKNVPKIWENMAVSSITALLFIIASNAYVGVGGRLGTIAAVSCFAWCGAKKIFTFKAHIGAKGKYNIMEIKR